MTDTPPVEGPRRVSDRPRGWLSSLLDVRTFRALQYRNFRYLWLAQISNSAALWIEQVARPILVLDLTGSAVQVGMILAARTFPQLGFGLIAGVLADWYNRRTLLLIAQISGMIINLIFALLLLFGKVELWHVYATTILRGIATSFDNPSRQALIPSLVDREHLSNAVALNSSSMQTMRIGGAFMAGLLLAAVGVPGTFLAVALISVLPAVLTNMMRIPPMPSAGRLGLKTGIVSLVEGLEFVWHTPTIRGVMFLTGSYFILGMAYLQVFAPIFAKQVLDIGDAGFGFMVSTTGIGALSGSLFVATFSPTKYRGRIMLVLMIILGSLLISFGASAYLPWIWPTFIIVAFIGIAQSSYFALSNTVLLENTPAEKRGRVMGVLALDRSMITLGGAAAGFTVAALGPQPAQMIFGAGCVITAVVLALTVSSLRDID